MLKIYFNPRTHVGCDLRRRIIRLDSINFNPRTHVECDDNNIRGSKTMLISIHAPTWGATRPLDERIAEFIFQSTHPRGVRHHNAILDGYMSRFQSTHPRGVRLTTTPMTSPPSDFNPRTHVGCDLQKFAVPLQCQHFNPRTHVGCDLDRLGLDSQQDISIHAPTWGATR